MTQAVVERLGRLAGERAAGGVGNRAGDHDRQLDAVFFEHLPAGEYGGLGVQGVENGLDQQQIGAAFDQAACGLHVVVHQILKRDVAKAGIVDIGRDRAGTAGGAEHAGDEAWFFGCGKPLGRPARDSCSRNVDLIRQVFHPVVCHRGAGGVEAVGLDDIRPGFQIGAVDVLDDLRLCQRQQVIVALEIGRPVDKPLATIIGLTQFMALDHRAHGAVKDQNAVGEQGFNLAAGCHERTCVENGMEGIIQISAPG